MRTIDRRNNRRKTNGRGPRALARWLLTLAVGLGGTGLGETLWAGEGDRAFSVAPVSPAPDTASAPVEVEIKGTYRALLIGIDDYSKTPFNNLESAEKDVKAVQKVLKEKYGFQDRNVKLLLNKNASRNGIINAFGKIRDDAKKEDSVFIYYAGHGDYKDDGDDDDKRKNKERRGSGWWVPSDAGRNPDGTRNEGSYVSNSDIRDYMAKIKARHVYLVADACFSGSLLTDNYQRDASTKYYYADAYKKPSRRVLTSGDIETVDDGRKKRHSVFVKSLLQVLTDNRARYLVPDKIYEDVRQLVKSKSGQNPRSGTVRVLDNTGTADEGGQFVFRLKDVACGSPTVTRPATPAGAPVSDPAPGPSKKKPENKWKTMLELLDKLLEEKTS